MFICKNCGKEFTEKYSKWSDGRFCCKECARSYSTKNKRKEINEKVSKTLLKKSDERIKCNPRVCCICGKKFIPTRRNNNEGFHRRETCSTSCARKLQNITRKKLNHSLGGGYRLNGHRKSYKGWYKGIYCDSTYELAYLIYCLDHNIDIKRCKETFKYEYEGKIHTYHPDFVVNGDIIEIKGIKSDIVDVKLKAVNKPIKILYYNDLIDIFEYVSKTYNKKYRKNSNNFYELYE